MKITLLAVVLLFAGTVQAMVQGPPASRPSAPVAAPKLLIESAVQRFSYSVWASKQAVFNAISVAYQLALALSRTTIVVGGDKNVDEDTPARRQKMARIISDVLKKFEERTPGLFPAGIDFEKLGSKIVEESVSKVRNNYELVGEDPETRSKYAIASLDDFSPELQTMVGFNPEEIAAAREFLLRAASAPARPPNPLPSHTVQNAPVPAGPVYVAPAPPQYAPPNVYAPPSAYPPAPQPGYPAQPNHGGPADNFHGTRQDANATQGSDLRQQCGNRRVDSRFGGSLYMFSWLSPGSPRFDWNSARGFCQSNCMDLVAMESAQENAFVESIVNQAWRQGQIPYIWTAGSRSGSGFFWATSGVPIPPPGAPGSHWGANNPDNREGAENCVAFMNPSVYNEPSGAFTWHDIACHYQKPIICEGR